MKEPTFDGYHEFDSTNLGVLGTSTVIWNNPDGGPAGIMTTEALKELCTAPGGKPTCQSFIDAPPPAGWDVWQFTANPNVTSYISNSACIPEPGSCDLGGRFLKCHGLDISQAPISMETYDLPPKIIEQACRVKGCHFFTVEVDGSGGTLYEFAPSNTTSTYIALD